MIKAEMVTVAAKPMKGVLVAFFKAIPPVEISTLDVKLRAAFCREFEGNIHDYFTSNRAIILQTFSSQCALRVRGLTEVGNC